MRPQMVMFLGLLACAGTLISVTFGGDWLSSDDLSILNSLTVFKEVNILGLWTINIPNFDFFFTGMKSLMMMDFAFFTGYMRIVQWFLFFTLIAGVLWGMYTIIISVVQSAIGRA